MAKRRAGSDPPGEPADKRARRGAGLPPDETVAGPSGGLPERPEADSPDADPPADNEGGTPARIDGADISDLTAAAADGQQRLIDTTVAPEQVITNTANTDSQVMCYEDVTTVLVSAS